MAAAALVLFSWACNTRSSVLDDVAVPTAPTPGAIGPAVPTPMATLFSLSLTPTGMWGGAPARGTTVLTLPAPADGTTISLASSDPAVTVPHAVVVPAGMDRAEFPVVTQTVQRDQQVTIVASVPGRSVSAALSLWGVLPTFFSFSSDPGHAIGRGDSVRLTADTSAFTAWCNASRVTVTTSTGSWRTVFGERSNVPLREGTYENAVAPAICPTCGQDLAPVMELAGRGSTCTGRGRFVIHELDMSANGVVRRFWASFEHQCVGRSDVLKGDIRVANPAPLNSSLRCVVP